MLPRLVLPSSLPLGEEISTCLSYLLTRLNTPRWGKKNMIWYLLICSMIGGLSVSVTTGLGSAIVTSVKGDNQVRALIPREIDTQTLLLFPVV